MKPVLLLLAIVAVPQQTVRSEALDGWSIPSITLPQDGKHPFLACTPEELGRLRAAFRSEGPEYSAVAPIVQMAEKALEQAVEYPPRGGQHNQWYQCDECQIALKTVDPTHHRCPQCDKVYSGEPYDDVLFSKTHGANIRNMNRAAWAYALTGEARFAEFAKEVLLGYAERYSKYPYHCNRPDPYEYTDSGGHLEEQTLDEAYLMSTFIAPGYDLIYESGVLSERDRKKIRVGLFIPLLRNVEKYKAKKSNWQSWHNAALLCGGVVLGDASWVEKAISDPENGFARQMEISVTEDGMWYENSWGYHFYTLRALVLTAEGARRSGIDLWNHPKFKRMFTVPMGYTMADGSLPRFADDVHSTLGSIRSMGEKAYAVYGDPVLLPALARTPTWETIMAGRLPSEEEPEPPLQSQLFPSAGHAILRTQGAPGLTTAMTYGPYGGGHGHLDKLSFVFFGLGKELGVDPGRARSQAYRLPIHKNWYKATISHNTVLVDRKPQNPASGSLEAFAANDRYATAMAKCIEAYPGVAHRRLLVQTPTYLLVFDHLESENEHRYDWVYHNRGTVAECAAALEPASLESSFSGSEYIENALSGSSEETVQVRFPDEGVTTYLTLAEGGQTGITTGDGVGGSILERIPLVIFTQHGRETCFAAALEPVAEGREPQVREVTFSADGGEAVVTVQNGERTETISISPDSEVSVHVENDVVLESTVEKRD